MVLIRSCLLTAEIRGSLEERAREGLQGLGDLGLPPSTLL